MITIVLNVQTDTNKIQLLRLRNLKDVSNHVLLERSSVMNFVRNVIKPAKNVLLDMIIIVLSVLMDLYKMELIYSKAPKNV